MFPFSYMSADWIGAFAPAIRVWLAGGNPYSVPGFYSPVWVLVLLAPLAYLPTVWGQVAVMGLGFVAFGACLIKTHTSRLNTFLFMASSPAMFAIVVGNIDWLPMLALWAPAPVGIFIALLKPQTGMGLAAYWAVEIWRREGIKGLITQAAPPVVLVAAPIAVYGLPDYSALTNAPWNISLAFPFLAPLGVGLVVYALRRHNPIWTMPASLTLTPYLSYGSLSGLLFALTPCRLALPLAVVALWVQRLIWH